MSSIYFYLLSCVRKVGVCACACVREKEHNVFVFVLVMFKCVGGGWVLVIASGPKGT